MPVWLTLFMVIISGVLASAGTYFLVPEINAELQRQEVRSRYLLDNIKVLNGAVISLWRSTNGMVNQAIETGHFAQNERYEILQQLTELQWRVIDLQVILGDPRGIRVIQLYSEAAANLRREVEALGARPLRLEDEQIDSLFRELEKFAVAAAALLEELYSRAGFSVDIAPLS